MSRLRAWLFRLDAGEQKEVVLVQRRIFILPTRSGLVFAAVLLLMLAGSINYSLSLGFLLTFLLAALAITGMLHTFRNIAGLRITAGRTAPVFAGETAHFRVNIENRSPSDRYGVALTRDRREVTIVDVPAESTAIASAGAAAIRRGLLRPGRLTVFSRFPLGLFQAWSYVALDTACLVYPRPAPPGLPLPRFTAGHSDGAGSGQGLDDFSGLRSYQPGDSPRHIAWKSAARSEALLTKHFVGGAHTELWLGLTHLPVELGIEEKLARLARWILDAHAQGLAYGLDLHGTRVRIGRGESHRDRCLEALALFDPSHPTQAA